MKEKLAAFMPRHTRFPLAMALVWTAVSYWASKPLLAGRELAYVEIALDGRIPLLPWTAVIYFLAFFFWGFTFIAVARQSRDSAERLLSADFLAKMVCVVLFIAVPCTNHRPELNGDGIFLEIMRFLYWIDPPTNLFPSIHCMESVLCWLGIRSEKGFAPVWRVLSFLAAIAVCVSTLTTKQHVLVDVAGGILLAGICYWLVAHTGFARWYGRTLDRCRRKPGESRA